MLSSMTSFEPFNVMYSERCYVFVDCCYVRPCLMRSPLCADGGCSGAVLAVVGHSDGDYSYRPAGRLPMEVVFKR
jgi:hypothetical protein